MWKLPQNVFNFAVPTNYYTIGYRRHLETSFVRILGSKTKSTKAHLIVFNCFINSSGVVRTENTYNILGSRSDLMMVTYQKVRGLGNSTTVFVFECLLIYHKNFSVIGQYHYK